MFNRPAYYKRAKKSRLARSTAPVCTHLPVISGVVNAGAGEVLHCKEGTWDNAKSYAFQWKRGGSNLSGATSGDYTTQAGDVGQTLTCVVTATNLVGDTTATTPGRAVTA